MPTWKAMAWRLGDARDEQAEAERADEVDERGDEQVQVGPAHRHAEEDARGDRMMTVVAASEMREVGERLADDQLARAQRGDAQLLHRAALLLAHDRRARSRARPVSIRMKPIRPGTRNCVDSSSGLYQTRGS